MRKVSRLKKKNQFLFITSFSIDINTLSANFQQKCTELQSDIQLKNLIMSLPDFHNPCLTREKYPFLHSHTPIDIYRYLLNIYGDETVDMNTGCGRCVSAVTVVIVGHFHRCKFLSVECRLLFIVGENA